MAYSVIAGNNFDFATTIFDDLRSMIEKTERDPKIPYVRFICAYLKFLYANAYPTTVDGSFAKVGRRSLEVKPLANEVSISTLRSRLSLHASSTSAATQEVLSSANHAATTGFKRPSASSFGPSKKAKVTKEKPATSSRPEEVSRQTSLDDFVVLFSTSAAITSTVPATSVAVTTTVTQPKISVHQSIELKASQLSALQAEIVKVKEDTQRQFDTLSTKVDACIALLQQVLTKLNAPAPTHSPSFTSDDLTQLNIAVEFIHRDTSDFLVIEGRLDSLEAEVRKLASVADQAPPSFKDFVEEEEEEDEDEEDLDLEDQEKSNLIKKMMMMTMKKISPYGVLLQPSHLSDTFERSYHSRGESWNILRIPFPRQFSPLLKGKELQIIPAAVADEQIIPVSVRENDEEDEEEESLQHPGRPSRPSYWS
ncbi:hypothetical protein L6452_18133 [Arctium lappa]|uniref:Uncharacterized protein n=1 Tax=Arctium lappa TaxID=4217 RepID=A0ACB9C5D1_ARCLA|nr:hypothetical protein L6452_18133 [Arctium lappa]